MKINLIVCLVLTLAMTACMSGALPGGQTTVGSDDTQMPDSDVLGMTPDSKAAATALNVPAMQASYTAADLLTITPSIPIMTTSFSTDDTMPLTFSGTGNAIINNARDMAQIRYTGTGEFKLIANHRQDWVIVDTIGDYSGTRRTEFSDENTCKPDNHLLQDCDAENMEVITEGNWEITQLWLNMATPYDGHLFKSHGDEVLNALEGGLSAKDSSMNPMPPLTFHFMCSDCQGALRIYFKIESAWSQQPSLDTIGPYSGNVVAPNNKYWPWIIAIEANGNWSIEMIQPAPA